MVATSMDAILESLGPKKVALLSKRILNRIATRSDSPLFSDDEREKLVTSFRVSSVEEVDALRFWKEVICEDTADRIQSMDLGAETRATFIQIWEELGKALLAQQNQKSAKPRPPVAVPGDVPDLLDIDYSVGVVVARKENDDSLPKPVMQMELSTNAGAVNVELDFDQLAALHYALRDAQAHLDSS